MFRKQTLFQSVFIAAAVFILFAACPQPDTTRITDGTVSSFRKISSTKGGFGGALEGSDFFGSATAAPGDIDGDGNPDIIVGAYTHDSGGTDIGAVWVLFLLSDGTVAGRTKISEGSGGFGGSLDDSDYFGSEITVLGDMNGDGINDIAVGAHGDDDGGADSNRGAVWVLLLNSDGTVSGEQKISDTAGGFEGTLVDDDIFGRGLAAAGDLNDDGVPDLIVGAPGDNDGGTDRGALWVLFLNSDGTVSGERKISSTTGGFGGTLDDSDAFGESIAMLGDLDGDGMPEIGVGAPRDDDGGTDRGAVWILSLRNDGTVGGHQKINSTDGGFGGILDDTDYFGAWVDAPGDLDDNGVPDLLVNSLFDDDGGSGPSSERGAVWVLFLDTDGTVAVYQKISDTEGNFAGTLEDNDSFGASIASPGDIDGDDIPDLVVGADGDDDGADEAGAVWVLFLAEAAEE
jgi:hypothetical protein